MMMMKLNDLSEQAAGDLDGHDGALADVLLDHRAERRVGLGALRSQQVTGGQVHVAKLLQMQRAMFSPLGRQRYLRRQRLKLIIY